MEGRDGVGLSQNHCSRKKNRVDPTKNGRTFLNNGTDISHRLVMVKYYTDKCRVKKYFHKTERV
jgi:hypothetical protein